MKRLTLFVTSVLLTVFSLWAQTTDETEKPLVTIGCLSDVHAMHSMLTPTSGLIKDVTVRSSFIQTLRQMKEQEDVDIIVLGGDCQSDKTIAEANSMQVRRVINNVTRDVFSEGKPKNVLWVTGNHDYEVANFDDIPKPYCAGDFYRFPMKDDVGELDESDLFFEDADNGTLGTQTLLAALHYRLCGLDFIILNCGKNFWKSAWDYTYSPESAQWVKEKLDEIYADDPNRTVFFCLHIPFPDSNSLNSGKGMNTGAAYTTLKNAFCEHPNLIMLYGHDHGKDGAYTREKTSQRITRYDIKGNVISTTDANHIDGPVIPNEEGPYPAIYKKMLICSTHDNTYLGWGEHNLSTVSTPAVSTISRNSGQYTYSIKPNDAPDGWGKYILSSTGGRFSGNNSPLKIYLYSVEYTSATTLTLTRDALPENGGHYVIVGQNAKDNSTYYALTNEHYSDDSSGQRLLGKQITNLQNGEPAPSFKASASSMARCIWEFKDAETPQETSIKLYVHSKQDGMYLGYNAYNLTTQDKPLQTDFRKAEGENFYHLGIGGSGGKFLTSSSSGRFSGNEVAASTYLYKVTEEADGQLTFTRDAVPQDDGSTYMFVTQNAKDATTYYALTCDHYSDGNSSQRLLGKQITQKGEDGTPAATLSFKESEIKNCLWLLEEHVEVEEGEGSFFSAFMGSMRYYYNSIDEGDPSDMPTVVQALMVYVYPDRVVLSMKNYNQTGMLQGITINKELATYTSYRPVTLYSDPDNIITNIKKVEKFEVKQPNVYDLGGRLCQPTEKLHPGVYIQGGVKFVK